MLKKHGTFAFLLLFSGFLELDIWGVPIEILQPDLISRGGLCVVLGGLDDLAVTDTLLRKGPWVIHCLDSMESRVEKTRHELQRRGLYGQIVVEHWNESNLPYADHLVNLILGNVMDPVSEHDELLRVLAPSGEAFIANRKDLIHLHKSRPEGMGDWTHPWQGSDGNLASGDRYLDIPNTFQWIAGPPFPLANRKDSCGAILSAGGRVFFLTQNVPENIGGENRNYLVTRDAFNGIVLWSRLWEGPLSLGHSDGYHEAIVVTENHVYGARKRGVAVYGASDGSLTGFWSTESTPNKLLSADDVLVAQSPHGLTAFDLNQGSQLWHFDADNPWGTLIRNGRVFFIYGTRQEDGRWRHLLLALDHHDGHILWEKQVESEYTHRDTYVLRLHFAGDDFVSLIERTVLRVLSAEDGRELWRRESQAEARGLGGMDSRQVGHFFVDGILWMRANRAQEGRTVPEDWLALDPLTGEVLREVKATGPQGVIENVNKVSCQPLTATSKFVLDSRLSTIWDFETGQRQGFKFARGGCQVGMIPANGLGYIPPNACGCLEEQVRGTMALVHSKDMGLHSFAPAPLLHGPAYGMKPPSPVEGETSVWPAYRHDGQRGAFFSGRLPDDPVEIWKTTIELQAEDRDGEWVLHFGRPLTAPVVADGIVALAEPQTHQVIALDNSSGREKWRFTAGGRVTTPPTLYRGLALFGAHDGYVYALRSEDGVLVWRRRTAPSDRRIIAYGQLESTWPVAGSILVHKERALAVAGRATDEGGGLVVHAMEPFSGDLLWTRRIKNARYGTGDLLVTDATHAYLMNMRIDTESGEIVELQDFQYGQSERGGAWIEYPDDVRYLRGGKAGLLGTSWTRLDLGLRKGQLTWTWGKAEGEIMAFTEHTSFAFQIDAGGLDSQGRQLMWRSPVCRGGGIIEARDADSDVPRWSFKLSAPSQVEAMLTTTGALFISGPMDRSQPEGGGFLRVISHEQGSELSEIFLPSAPVHDGIAAANGRIFLVLRDGSVLCLG